jgi:hypothetical protein
MSTEPSRPGGRVLACDVGAFTAEERSDWRALGARLLGARQTLRELANGFAFEIERTPATLGDLGRFVAYESRCCPFVDFVVRVEAGASSAVLEMTGPPGIKELLAAELGLAR